MPELADDTGAATEHFDQEELDGKVTQLVAARDTLQALLPVFEPFQTAFDAFRAAFNGEEPVDNFYTASVNFEEAQFELEDVDPAESLASFVDDLLCVARALARGPGYMEDAAQAERDGDDGKADTASDRARDAFASCDTVEEEVEY